MSDAEQKLREQIVEIAKSFIGTPYSWSNPEEGINCAGLVGEVLSGVCPQFAEYWKDCNRGMGLAFPSGSAPEYCAQPGFRAGGAWGPFVTKISQAWGHLKEPGAAPELGDWALFWETNPKDYVHLGIHCGKTFVTALAGVGTLEVAWTDALLVQRGEVYSWRGLDE